jgi:glucokinase
LRVADAWEASVILAGDVGATKILLEVGDVRGGQWESSHARSYATGAAANFGAVLKEFLEEWQASGQTPKRIAAAAFGVAGPALGNRVKMTHRPWTIDGDLIAQRFPIAKVRVVNDLVAIAHGIDWVSPREVISLQPGKAAPDEARVVIGVGTGLGVAYLAPAGDGRYRELPGEGGHMGFAPATFAEAELWRTVFALHGRVSAEDVASGRGLSHVYDFVRGGPRPGEIHAISAQWITENAALGNAECVTTLELFAACLGNIAGDHALAVMARGGVYLAGGVASKILPQLRAPRFREAFCAKGAHSALLMKIPVRAITSERVGVLGAARLASEL